MSSYTSGPWRVGPPIFDGDVIFAPPQTEGRRNEVVAMGILNKADARLIAAAPDLLRLLRIAYDDLRELGFCTVLPEIDEILTRIEGKEGKDLNEP